MSIYGTLRDWMIGGDMVFFQCVPAHITESGAAWAFLSPPIADPEDEGGEPTCRDVFVVCEHTKKGSPRNGQEYIEPLMRMSYADYTIAMATKPRRDALRERIRRLMEATHGDGLDGRSRAARPHHDLLGS